MYAVSNRYKEVIYSQDARHKLKIWFNNVDYETITNGEQDADDICEKMTVKSRIIPFGSKIFMLENFISKEVELILHDIDISVIQNPIKISLGTLVDNDYEYVPIGIFNLQDKPTTDKGKTTITLRDNSVKFDFNYNAQPLIEEHGGIATKLQILQDICEKAGVTCNVTDFLGKDDEIGIYDNTKTGRMYISYIAGQGGAIATINRNGELIFIYINNLTTVEIPMWYVESYTNGDKFKISRVVYESGIIKYESGTTDNDTLFLDASNPYVSGETQVANILNIVNGFEINSFSTGKILGNPAIDSYDLISIYDEDTDTTYITFACNELVYNGVCIQKFDSEIGLEAKTENVTNINNNEQFKKWATTTINNIDGTVAIMTGDIKTLYDDFGNTYTQKEINDLIANAQTGLTNTFSQTGGTNIFRNTGLWFTTNDTNNPYEFWQGKVVRQKEDNAKNLYALILQNNTLTQEEIVPNGIYTIGFKYKKLINLSTVKAFINDVEYELTETNETEFAQTIEVKSQYINIKFISDTNNACEIYDLMANYGDNKLIYSQNQNETTTDTVNISKGITITSSELDTIFKANADGTRILDKNGVVITKFTDVGMTTKKQVVEEEANIVDILFQKVGNHVWLTKI